MDAPRNYIREQKEFDYELCPEGVSVMGLVKIKEQKVGGAAFGQKDGYRLIFRSRSNPAVFLNLDLAASCHIRSNLVKVLKRMTASKFKPDEATAINTYDTLIAQLNKWFEVEVKHKPWEGPKGTVIFAKVDDNEVRPVTIPGPDPVDFFASANQSKTDEAAYETAKVEAAAEVKDDDIPF